MLPKDRSITTSLKSTTADWETPIQFVKGVGPKLGAVFQNKDIHTVRDLLHFFPRAYEDRSKILQIRDLADDTKATLQVRVVSQRQFFVLRLGRSILEVRCQDESGVLGLKWFYPPRGIEKRFVPGLNITVTGKVKFFSGKPEMVHPEVSFAAQMAAAPDDTAGSHNYGRVVPVYVELEGVPSRTFRKVLWEALEKFSAKAPEDLPPYLLERRKLPQLSKAIQAIHFPPESGSESSLGDLVEFKTPAHQRLIYEEFFKFEYLMLRNRLNVERCLSRPFRTKEGLQKIQTLVKKLPFQLTQGQRESLKAILDDLSQESPMHRLIQGDVGAGKTAVAFLSAARVLAEGGQVALMAPTEILAEQHYKNASILFGTELNVALLTGSTGSAERNQLLTRLKEGEPLLVIGTHALIEDRVVFARLEYTLIDEQHRFGVEQRRRLKEKGTRIIESGESVKESGKRFLPHSLILTATPIPRTLALTAFGDLEVSLIRDLPPGRTPVKTEVARTKAQRESVFRRIRSELEAGRQAYFIYPLVNDSEAEGFTHLKSAVAQAEHIGHDVFPEFSIGLLHGQMTSDEKSQVMNEFKNGKTKILVSTTVIEVGVDVPNSTLIVIEHAERFGLSQLHQLRGRVGRGQHQSYCFLFSHQTPELSARLNVMENIQDGFKIAEADLEFRGPGEFLGTRQAGSLPFRLGNLVRDRDLLIQARDDAMEIMRTDPDLNSPALDNLKKYFLREGSTQFARLNTY